MSHEELQKGEMIASRFRVLERIGEGGMGAVYRAVQQPLGREVALKVIRPEAADRAEMLGRFEAEAKAIAGLRHPGIVTLYDFGPLERGGLFLAMEFVEGQTLRQRLADSGRLSAEEASRIVRAMAKALADAHRNDVVHRDLKPANVMLCADDANTCAKLVDFGLSCRLDADDDQGQTKTGALMGTPGYIAPETALSGLKRDPRADLYALGVMWFEMLTGRAPFEAGTPVALVLKHAQEAPPRPSQLAPHTSIPGAVEQLILRLMAKDPAERPSDAGEVVELLRELQIGPKTPTRGQSMGSALASAPTRAASLSATDLLHRSDKPVVAVLPFTNMSDEAAQEFFSDGITEDLITALSRFRSVSVIARQSAFALKGENVSPEKLARDLGAWYALEGSVRKAGDQVRISAQLVDVRQGHQLWGQRYDRTLEDIFAVQDDVTQAIVAAIPRQLHDADLQRARRKTSANMAAYELFLRGRNCHHRGTAEANAQGIEFLKRAVELDPDYAQAWAWLSCTYGQAAIRGYTDNQPATFRACVEAVEKAHELDDGDSECHRILCEIRLLDQQWEQAQSHHQRALSLNPNDPAIIAQRGFVMLCMGKPEDGIEWVEEAMRLDPMHPEGYQDHLGRLLFAARRYEEAADALSRLANPGVKHLAFLAACMARLDRVDQAQRVAEQVRELDPDFSAGVHVRMIPYRFTADRKHHAESLALAGL